MTYACNDTLPIISITILNKKRDKKLLKSIKRLNYNRYYEYYKNIVIT